MDDISVKYNLLDEPSKKEVRKFVHFLLLKKQAKKDRKTFKSSLLKVSQWREEDIVAMDENKKLLNA